MQAESELKHLASVYDVYASHVDSLRLFSASLWNDTDLPRLEAAALDNDRKLRALQQLSGLPVFQAVQAVAAEFAAVLPLLRSLRHEALRLRHWEELMETTGSRFCWCIQLCRSAYLHWGVRGAECHIVRGMFSCHFAGTHIDMNPATLTLGALLGLHLHQHADSVARVCASAFKELTIELELRKVAELWRSQRFKLHRYTSGGTEDRGWVLKGDGLEYCLRSPQSEAPA